MNSKLLELFYKLKKFNNKFKNKKLRFITNDCVYESNFFYTYLLQQCEVLKESPYKDILFNYLIKSENVYPGSSYYLVEKLLLKLNGNNNESIKVKTESNLFNFKRYLQKVSSRKEYVDLFLSILHFSGPDAVLTCKPTNNIETTVVKKNNTKFDINIHESFSGIYFSNQRETTKEFITSVMDVYIEKESEIMSLMNYASEQKMPVVLVCRGISDYAVKALRNIILKSGVYIYPYIAKFDNEDPFIMNDLSDAFDINLFSLESGDSLYTGIVEKTSCKRLKLKPESIEVFKINKALVDKINKQISKADGEVKKYLLKRKNRITPNIVEIHVPKSNIKFIDEIKSLIRCYNSCIVFGLLEDENKNIIPVREDLITKTLSDKLFDCLNNIGCVVIKDKNVWSY